MTVPWAVRGISQSTEKFFRVMFWQRSKVKGCIRPCMINSEPQYGKDFRIDIVSIRFVIISFNGVLCPKVISPLGKDKRGAGMLFAGIDCFLYKRYGIDAAVGL